MTTTNDTTGPLGPYGGRRAARRRYRAAMPRTVSPADPAAPMLDDGEVYPVNRAARRRAAAALRRRRGWRNYP